MTDYRCMYVRKHHQTAESSGLKPSRAGSISIRAGRGASRPFLCGDFKFRNCGVGSPEMGLEPDLAPRGLRVFGRTWTLNWHFCEPHHYTRSTTLDALYPCEHISASACQETHLWYCRVSPAIRPPGRWDVRSVETGLLYKEFFLSVRC